MVQNKYILIISQESEKSTDDVLRYLLFYNAPFIRVNETDIVDEIDISIGIEDSTKIAFRNTQISIEELKAVWYRRGKLNAGVILKDKLSDADKASYQQYLNFYQEEVRLLMEYIYLRMRNVKHINSFRDNFTNKLVQLSIAKKHGLRIPESYLVNSLVTVGNHLESSELIIKSLSFPIFSVKEGSKTIKYLANTSVLLTKDIFIKRINSYLNRKSLITFYQAYVEKKFEIRSFYLRGKFFSMAIFSQQNEKTRIDFRNYDRRRPNRMVPFKLPCQIEHQIDCFMNEMNLNSGSLDLIYTKNKKYTFLEVNPIGQFDWLSKECNYFIDMEIAKELINES